MTSGDKKKIQISIETKYIKGHEFCLYDVDCKFVNNIHRSSAIGKTGFEPITSAQPPVNRVKVISMDENGRDVNRYKTKSEGEINLQDFTSFMFGSILQYQCGPGRMFELSRTEHNILIGNQATNSSYSSNRLYAKLNISCNWDGQWSLPTFLVPKCVCKFKTFHLVRIYQTKVIFSI
jgi:hypothetical protein